MTDSPGENRPAHLSGLSADIKAAAGAIGWLAGAMSGVVALLYAVGFLSAKSHLNMLGIETYSGVDAGAYVEIGAKFFYITVIILFEGLIDLGRTVLPALAVIVIPALVITAGAATVIARMRRTGIRDMLRQWFGALKKGGPDALPALILLSFFLALVLIWAGSQYRSVFAPVQISGVLHTVCTDVSNAGDAASLLACRIRRQEHAIPRAYYAGLVNLVFGLFLVVVPFRQRFLRRTATRIFYLPLMILFMVYTLVLPLTYGALVMPNDFPKVNIYARRDSEIRIPDGPFYLIHQGKASMILWHAGKAASYVIPASEITTLEVIDRASLFSDPPSSPDTQLPGGLP